MPPGSADRAASPKTSLSEIARALDLPVSSFFAMGPDGAMPEAGDRPDVAALLELVRLHMLRASPEARRDFIARVRAMAESVSRPVSDPEP